MADDFFIDTSDDEWQNTEDDEWVGIGATTPPPVTTEAPATEAPSTEVPATEPPPASMAPVELVYTRIARFRSPKRQHFFRSL